jgi:hypothetical protein
VDVVDRAGGEGPSVLATTGHEIPVHLRDRGRADGLEPQDADVRLDVPVDHVPVVGECLGLDLDRVSFNPFVEVFADRDRVAVDVLASSGFDTGFVAGGLGVVLGGEAAHPSRLTLSGSGVSDPDHV